LLDTIIDTAQREVRKGEKLSQEVGDVTAVAVGGFHTTGTVLTWMLYYLTIHPKIQEKVVNELETVLGDNDITEDSIKNLTY
jgi:cytochrome P450